MYWIGKSILIYICVHTWTNKRFCIKFNVSTQAHVSGSNFGTIADEKSTRETRTAPINLSGNSSSVFPWEQRQQHQKNFHIRDWLLGHMMNLSITTLVWTKLQETIVSKESSYYHCSCYFNTMFAFKADTGKWEFIKRWLLNVR